MSAPYPDIEAVLVTYLRDLADTGDQTPASLEAPFLRIQRVGGFDDGIADRPRVEVAAYAPTRREAQILSEEVRQRVQDLAGTSDAGVHIDTVRTEVQSGRTPYENLSLIHI